MKKITFFAAAVAVAVLSLAACTRVESGRQDSAKRISLDAGISPTRAATYGDSEIFETGDKISLYAWMGTAEAVPANPVVNGVENELQANGTWKPAVDMFWANFISPHYFVGIYPVRTVSSFIADSYTLVPTDYEASDLLVATNFSGLTASDDPVRLTFKHMMARLQVNMTFRSQFSGTPAVDVVATAASTCKVNYLTESVAPDAQGSVKLVKLDTPAPGSALSYQSIMIPQEGFRTVTLTIEGKEYSFTNPADIKLAAGKVTVLDLIVGRDRIDLASDIAIKDWSAGNTYSGNADDED